MGTEKEVAAFVERVAKRLSETPHAPQAGRHRAAFVALRPLIEGALASGCTMKATWATLRDEQKLSMSYQTFRMHCRQAGLGRKGPGSSDRPGPSRSPACPHAQAVAPNASDAQQVGFRHVRVPRKRDIYG